MAKKTVSQKRAQRLEQEAVAFQKTLDVCLVGLLAEFYLLLVNRCYINGRPSLMLSWHQVLQVGLYVGVAVFAVGLVMAVRLAKKEGISPRCKKLTLLLALVGLFLAGSDVMVLRYFEKGVLLLSAVVPVVTVLALIYLLFPADCFVTTGLYALTFGAVWICRQTGGTTARVVAFGMAVVILLCTMLANAARADGGRIMERRIFPADCSYIALALAGILCLIAVVLALLVPSVAVYGQWLVGIAAFCDVVYYTIKMM